MMPNLQTLLLQEEAISAAIKQCSTIAADAPGGLYSIERITDALKEFPNFESLNRIPQRVGTPGHAVRAALGTLSQFAESNRQQMPEMLSRVKLILADGLNAVRTDLAYANKNLL